MEHTEKNGGQGQEPPVSILIADDTPDNRLLLRAMLRGSRYRIDEAMNGVEAVEKFKGGRYAVVLMDMQMPVMDGFGATREIRLFEQSHGLPMTPIVALTAFAFPEDARDCLAAGCTMHLAKPIRRTSLLACLARLSEGGSP